jgi:hypothetical protein
MQGFPFTFSIDAAGSPDAITLPHDFPTGVRTLRLRPPAGHAWNYYGPGSTYYALGTDEELVLGPGPYHAGETIGSASLDTGTGTGRGIAS